MSGVLFWHLVWWSQTAYTIYLNALAATIPRGQWFAITAYIYAYSVVDIPRVKGQIYKKHNGYKLNL